jgi:6-phosphogluconolactonase
MTAKCFRVAAFALLAFYFALGDPGRSQAGPSDRYFVYLGTYTGPKSKGIYSFNYRAGTQKFDFMGLAAQSINPSFVVSDPRYHFLYAVNERGESPPIDGSSPTGSISAFSMDVHTGQLKFLNKTSSAGRTPAHLVVDKFGKTLFVANYGNGSVGSFHIMRDGSIGALTSSYQHSGASVDPRRQQGPHAHAVVLSPDGRYLFVPDLGLDKIMAYKISADHTSIAPNAVPSVSVNPGLGPRHLAFSPDGNFAYAVCEIGSSVVAFSYDAANGVLAPIQTISTLPREFQGKNASAELAIDKAGRYLYASNRGDDSITVFAIDHEKGTLQRIQIVPTGGRTPRSFAFDPTGKLLLVANQDSDVVTMFSVDQTSGLLMVTGESLAVPSPVSILFVPAR